MLLLNYVIIEYINNLIGIRFWEMG